MKSKTTAGMLALVPAIIGLVSGGNLGLLNGLHWIYLGGRHTTKGIIYLLISLIVSPICILLGWTFSWLILPLALLLVPFVMSVINLIEGIKLLSMNQAEFDATYNDVYGSAPQTPRENPNSTPNANQNSGQFF